MRTSMVLTGFVLSIAACHEAPTETFVRPSGAAPSGLPVTLRITASTATPFSGRAIVADADSLAASAEYETTDCLEYTATAGVAGNLVVVTITEAPPSTMRYCLLTLGKAVYRAVVRPAPRGAYTVVLRQRLESSDGPMERERARESVTVP